jgi:hypothetical protein
MSLMLKTDFDLNAVIVGISARDTHLDLVLASPS